MVWVVCRCRRVVSPLCLCQSPANVIKNGTPTQSIYISLSFTRSSSNFCVGCHLPSRAVYDGQRSRYTHDVVDQKKQQNKTFCFGDNAFDLRNSVRPVDGAVGAPLPAVPCLNDGSRPSRRGCAACFIAFGGAARGQPPASKTAAHEPCRWPSNGSA